MKNKNWKPPTKKQVLFWKYGLNPITGYPPEKNKQEQRIYFNNQSTVKFTKPIKYKSL